MLAVLLAGILGLACFGGGKGETQDASSAARSGPGYILASGPTLEDVALSGTARSILTFQDGSLLMDPALSPDGTRIAFIRQEPVRNLGGGEIDFGSDLYLVNRDGSDLREVVHHSALAEYVRTPSWLDEHRLLFSVRGRTSAQVADYRVEMLDLRDGRRTRFASNAVDPSVTPDRKSVLMVSVETSTTRETLLLAGVDGSAARDLLPPEPKLTLIGSAVMSPDGSQVAFAAGDLLGATAAPPRTMPAVLHPFFQDLWIVDVDGGDLRRVAELAERSLSLSWSPDGRYIYAMGAERFRRVEVATGAVVSFGEGAPSAGIYVYPGR